ncbi:hypothetical protein NMY22_g19168 [Coprinellus aureogranulatus]|nr:hypothetical protein NMY22_g19168 [Coprinellus aureogranulatus]
MDFAHCKCIFDLSFNANPDHGQAFEIRGIDEVALSDQFIAEGSTPVGLNEILYPSNTAGVRVRVATEGTIRMNTKHGAQHTLRAQLGDHIPLGDKVKG